MHPQIGKVLIVFGALVMLVGIVLLFADKIPFLGKMPGDLTFRGKNYTVYIPIVSMLILSLLLTILLNIFGRGR